MCGAPSDIVALLARPQLPPRGLIMRFAWMVLLALATPVAAAEVGPCEGLDRISFLVGQTKSFSQGKITIAEVDTDGEPVCCSEHLLIFIPSREIGSQCFAVSEKAAKGDGSAR